jgi:hypothetical protein
MKDNYLIEQAAKGCIRSGFMTEAVALSGAHERYILSVSEDGEVTRTPISDEEFYKPVDADT